MDSLVEKTTPIIAIILVLAVVGLTAFKIEVPQQLWTGFSVVLGFFFGTVTTAARLRAR
jgi:hypothetical protein